MLYNQDGSFQVSYPHTPPGVVMPAYAVHPAAAGKGNLHSFTGKDQALSEWFANLQSVGYSQLVENCKKFSHSGQVSAAGPLAPMSIQQPAVQEAPNTTLIEAAFDGESHEPPADWYDEASFLVPLVQDSSPAAYQKDYWASDGYVDPYERSSSQAPNKVLLSLKSLKRQSARFPQLSEALQSKQQSATQYAADHATTCDTCVTAPRCYATCYVQLPSSENLTFPSPLEGQNCRISMPAAPSNQDETLEVQQQQQEEAEAQDSGVPQSVQVSQAAGFDGLSKDSLPEPLSEVTNQISCSEQDEAAPVQIQNSHAAVTVDSGAGFDDKKTQNVPANEPKGLPRELQQLMHIEMNWSAAQEGVTRRSSRRDKAAQEEDKVLAASAKKCKEEESKPASSGQVLQPARTNSKVPKVEVKVSLDGSNEKEREWLFSTQPAAVIHLAACLKRDLRLHNDSAVVIKRLLSSGILCGQPIHYHRATRNYLCNGWIAASGMILCNCTNCKGKVEVSLTAFELHAGSAYKRPTEGIILTNFGVTLKDLHIAVQLVEETDDIPSGPCQVCSNNNPAPIRCFSCLSSFHEGCVDRPNQGIWFCQQCSEAQKADGYEPPSCMARLTVVTQTPVAGKTPAAAKASAAGKTPAASKVSVAGKTPATGKTAGGTTGTPLPSTAGKHTKVRMTIMAPSMRNRSLARQHTRQNKHKNLFFAEVGILADGQKLKYMAAGQVLLRGTAVIRDDARGILCECCNEVISPSAFEDHAGRGQARKPYDNIYTMEDMPLAKLSQQHQAGMMASQKDVDSAPVGKGYFGRKTARRGAEVQAVTAVAADADADADAEDDEDEEGIIDDNLGSGCVLCQMRDFQKGSFGNRTIMICDQCEREFHVGCLREHGRCDLKAVPEGDWFCSVQCGHVNATLTAQVKAGDAPIPGGHSWQLMKGKDGTSFTTRSLKIAHEILQGSFDPIIDQVSGEDLLPKMIYAQSFGEWDYTGMYSVLLRHKGKPVCSAVVRVFGDTLAELPLVATKHDARRKGHCRVLMNAVEDMLRSAGVLRLTMPAAHETVATWKGGFGFQDAPEDLRQVLEDDVRVLMFPGTEMLSKDLQQVSNAAPQAATNNAGMQVSAPSSAPMQLDANNTDGTDSQAAANNNSANYQTHNSKRPASKIARDDVEVHEQGVPPKPGSDIGPPNNQPVVDDTCTNPQPGLNAATHAAPASLSTSCERLGTFSNSSTPVEPQPSQGAPCTDTKQPANIEPAPVPRKRGRPPRSAAATPNQPPAKKSRFAAAAAQTPATVSRSHLSRKRGKDSEAVAVTGSQQRPIKKQVNAAEAVEVIESPLQLNKKHSKGTEAADGQEVEQDIQQELKQEPEDKEEGVVHSSSVGNKGGKARGRGRPKDRGRGHSEKVDSADKSGIGTDLQDGSETAPAVAGTQEQQQPQQASADKQVVRSDNCDSLNAERGLSPHDKAGSTTSTSTTLLQGDDGLQARDCVGKNGDHDVGSVNEQHDANGNNNTNGNSCEKQTDGLLGKRGAEECAGGFGKKQCTGHKLDATGNGDVFSSSIQQGCVDQQLVDSNSKRPAETDAMTSRNHKLDDGTTEPEVVTCHVSVDIGTTEPEVVIGHVSVDIGTTEPEVVIGHASVANANSGCQSKAPGNSGGAGYCCMPDANDPSLPASCTSPSKKPRATPPNQQPSDTAASLADAPCDTAMHPCPLGEPHGAFSEQPAADIGKGGGSCHAHPSSNGDHPASPAGTLHEDTGYSLCKSQTNPPDKQPSEPMSLSAPAVSQDKRTLQDDAESDVLHVSNADSRITTDTNPGTHAGCDAGDKARSIPARTPRKNLELVRLLKDSSRILGTDCNLPTNNSSLSPSAGAKRRHNHPDKHKPGNAKQEGDSGGVVSPRTRSAAAAIHGSGHEAKDGRYQIKTRAKLDRK